MKKSYEIPGGWLKKQANEIFELKCINKSCRVFLNFTKTVNSIVVFLTSIIVGLSVTIVPLKGQAFNVERPSVKSLQELDNTKYQKFFEYFSFQCDQRKAEKVGVGKFQDDCLLSQLMEAYLTNLNILQGISGDEGIFKEGFQVRKKWSTVDLLSGYFNERWSADEYGVKPIINRIVLEIAIRTELKKFKGFLDHNSLPGMHGLKRYYYPEMMAHYGGYSVVARVNTYQQSMSCDFGRMCPKSNPNCTTGLVCTKGEKGCGTKIQKSCRAGEKALSQIVQNSAKKHELITKILNDYKSLSGESSYTESQVIFDAIENSTIIYDKIQGQMTGNQVLEWVNNEDFCSAEVSNNPIDLLCNKINESLDFPKNIRDKRLTQALLGSLVIWEIQNISESNPIDQNNTVDLSDYPELVSFVNTTKSEVANELTNSIRVIREHFLDYDPSDLKNEVPKYTPKKTKPTPSYNEENAPLTS